MIVHYFNVIRTVVFPGKADPPLVVYPYTEKPSRDLDAANRALARLRAEFGEESVVCARLTDGHHPESTIYLGGRNPRQLPENVLNGAQWLNDLNGLNSSKC